VFGAPAVSNWPKSCEICCTGIQARILGHFLGKVQQYTTIYHLLIVPFTGCNGVFPDCPHSFHCKFQWATADRRDTKFVA
jgi:hypothetical protein